MAKQSLPGVGLWHRRRAIATKQKHGINGRCYPVGTPVISVAALWLSGPVVPSPPGDAVAGPWDGAPLAAGNAGFVELRRNRACDQIIDRMR
jgi:hypothetical protein